MHILIDTEPCHFMKYSPPVKTASMRALLTGRMQGCVVSVESFVRSYSLVSDSMHHLQPPSTPPYPPDLSDSRIGRLSDAANIIIDRSVLLPFV